MTQLDAHTATLPTTLPQLCLTALAERPRPDVLNNKADGKWQHISATEMRRRVRAIAIGLHDLGIRKGDRVALLSENRPEWSLTDMAILSLGAVNVPIYTTQAVEQVRYILEDSRARVLFVSNRRVFKHARPGVEGVATLERLVFFDDEAAANQQEALTLTELETRGTSLDATTPDVYDALVNAVHADDLATIIYTSGTTGEPKGVMLTHANFVSNVYSISNSLPISETDVSLSVLPLSHIFERTAFYVFCWTGMAVYYAASVDQLGEYLQEVRPTVMTAVPRLFEKLYHRIVKKGMAAKGWRQKLFAWALDTGKRSAELRDKGERVPPLLELQQDVASKLVFSKWRAGVGGRMRYFVSGGAPLSPALSYAFIAADIPVLQGYGMTEACIVAANRPDDNKVGSIGRPFPGIEMRVDAEGELHVRGPNVMRGYYNKPEDTAAVFTDDGWFMTGDVGYKDARGHFYITDRKKELFKLSNGKYVAPQLIESLIKQSELVSQVIVVGAGRKQPAALIVPDWEALQGALAESGVELQARGNNGRAAASREPAAVRLVQRDVAALTAGLSDYERVRRVALLPDEFSIDGGEMTPTLKIKRRVIDEKYGPVIDEIYGGSENN